MRDFFQGMCVAAKKISVLCVWGVGVIQRKLTSAWLVVDEHAQVNETRASCHSRRGVM